MKIFNKLRGNDYKNTEISQKDALIDDTRTQCKTVSTKKLSSTAGTKRCKKEGQEDNEEQ